jgi:hypothetical protein
VDQPTIGGARPRRQDCHDAAHRTNAFLFDSGHLGGTFLQARRMDDTGSEARSNFQGNRFSGDVI